MKITRREFKAAVAAAAEHLPYHQREAANHVADTVTETLTGAYGTPECGCPLTQAGLLPDTDPHRAFAYAFDAAMAVLGAGIQEARIVIVDEQVGIKRDVLMALVKSSALAAGLPDSEYLRLVEWARVAKQVGDNFDNGCPLAASGIYDDLLTLSPEHRRFYRGFDQAIIALGFGTLAGGRTKVID